MQSLMVPTYTRPVTAILLSVPIYAQTHTDSINNRFAKSVANAFEKSTLHFYRILNI